MSCQLCDGIADSVNNGMNSRLENRLLYSTKSFIVAPCIGPIEPGHVLLISKAHFENLSCMEVDALFEIDQLFNLLWEKLPEYYSNCIIAEHGAYDFQQKSGACIIHTHLHVIPNSIDSISIFDKILHYEEMNSIVELRKIDYPYILVASQEKIRVYNAENVPSQMIRKLVLAARGESDSWDWRSQPSNDFNEETLKIWQNVK